MTKFRTAYDRIQAGQLTKKAANDAVMKQFAAKRVYRKTPGHVLVEEFMAPNYLDVEDVVRIARIHYGTLINIIRGNAKVNEFVAMRLALMFRTSKEYWLGLQSNYDKGVAL